MLNQSRVLNYIKDHLGFPSMHLELSDENITDFVSEYTLREFSHYIPELKRMNLSLLNENAMVPSRSNEWYLEEPEGLEILSVVDVLFPLGHEIIFGHPIQGPYSHGEIKGWALDVAMAGDIRHFSEQNKNFEFIHPNVIRISPISPINVANVTIEYERVQPPDFRGIPNDLQVVFCKYALADVMIKVGRVRKKYEGQMNTPFGPVPISSEILEEGKELKQQIEDKLIETYLPNVTIKFG